MADSDVTERNCADTTKIPGYVPLSFCALSIVQAMRGLLNISTFLARDKREREGVCVCPDLFLLSPLAMGL